MESIAATRSVARERATRALPAVAGFVAGAGPTMLLGFSQGGYPVEVVAGYGVILWWLLLVGILSGAIARPRPNGAGWVAIAALAALSAFGLLSLTWSVAPERGLTEVVRMVVGGGSVVLGLSAVAAGQSRHLMGGVLAGLSAIVGAAVLARLDPGLFPGSQQTGELLTATRTRLSWPLNYWNTVGAAAAMVLPLGLGLAVRARTAWTSALAAAPLPVAALAIAYTLSRGGVLAAGVGLVAVVVLVAPRLVVLRTALAPAAGVAVLLYAGLHADALTDVTGGAAQDDAGRRVLVYGLLVTLAVAAAQAGWHTADQARWPRRVPRPGRRGAIGLVVAAVLVVVVAFAALDGPGRLDSAWDRFRDPSVARVDGRETSSRLSSISGNGRYQMWSGATDALGDHTVAGLGLGSWESWWTPRRGKTGFVRNTHSEVFELLAEGGVIGGGLFLLVLLTPLVGGGWMLLRRRARPGAVVALPALAAFAVSIALDWNWQVSAFPVAGLTLAAVLLGRGSGLPDARGPGRTERVLRVVRPTALALAAAASIAVLALALVAPQAVETSQAQAARGQLDRAAATARQGSDAVGFASSPVLQRALVLERGGRLADAASAAREATRRTPEDWRAWFVLARVEAARGRAPDAVAAFRVARRLNPESNLLR